MVICGDAGDAIAGEKRIGPSVVSKYEHKDSLLFDLILKGVFDTTASYDKFPCITSLWKKR